MLADGGDFWPAGRTERAPFAVAWIMFECRAAFGALSFDEVIRNATVRSVLGQKLRHENGIRPTS